MIFGEEQQEGELFSLVPRDILEEFDSEVKPAAPLILSPYITDIEGLTDDDIIKSAGKQYVEVTLAHIADLIMLQAHGQKSLIESGWANFLYIRNKRGELRNCHLSSHGGSSWMMVFTLPAEKGSWFKGNAVFLRSPN